MNHDAGTAPPQLGPELVSSELLHRNARFDLRRDVVRLPSGLTQDLVWVDHPGAVGIAAVEEDGRLVLVRQYRHAVKQQLLEIPAGRLEPGEDRLQAAIRELEEETGLRAAEWRLLQDILPAPGFASERLSIYLARGLSPAGPQAAACDADEELSLERHAPGDLLAGLTTDAKTLIAAGLLLRAPSRAAEAPLAD